MAQRDYYQILGVARSATEKEIRQAYRKLARTYHPDLNPGDQAAANRFKEISEAYEVLSDTGKRRQYDQFGHVGARFGGPGANGFGADAGGFHWSASGGVAGFDGLFDQLFQQVGRHRPGGRASAQRGQDQEIPIEISLEEALSGTTRTVRVDGAGGTTKTLEVTIRPGVGEGSRIRVAHQAASGFQGGVNGDLYLLVHLRPHARFERKGDDLHTKVQVPVHRAVLGGEVEVGTLSGGRLALRLPPETQNGQRFRLTGQGMPKLHGGGRGDLYAEVQVLVPTSVSERERRLFSELASLRGE